MNESESIIDLIPKFNEDRELLSFLKDLERNDGQWVSIFAEIYYSSGVVRMRFTTALLTYMTDRTNLEIFDMQQSVISYRSIVESMKLSHDPIPQRDGGTIDVIQRWPQEHAAVDSHRRLGKKYG